MDTNTLKLFALYNAETNKKMNTFIAALKQAEWEKEFKGHFKSVKSLCNHLYIGDFNWLKRFSKLRKFAFANHDIFSKDITFSEVVTGTVDEYLEKRKALDAYIAEFTDDLKSEDLALNLTYVDSRGNEYTKNFGGLVIHMFNHQTHHRGMISLYLEELGIANDYSNFNSIL